MGINGCRNCGPGAPIRGLGEVPDPGRKWWEFWKTIPCASCGGDGYAKPPGWPDEKEINRLRPKPSPAPPRKK